MYFYMFLHVSTCFYTERDIARVEDSCTIFLGRRRICFELVPPVRPEMIAVRRLLGGDEAQRDTKRSKSRKRYERDMKEIADK